MRFHLFLLLAFFSFSSCDLLTQNENDDPNSEDLIFESIGFLSAMDVSEDGLKVLLHREEGAGIIDLSTNNFSILPIEGTPIDISADGNLVLYDRLHTLNIINADGTNDIRNLGDSVFQESGVFTQEPARFINNGEKILFDGYLKVQEGYQRNVGIINSDGTNFEILVDFFSRAVDVSPDGQKILFAGDSTGRQSFPWVVNIDGTNPINLSQNIENRVWGNPIRFTSDGQKILYYNRYPEYKLYMVDIESPNNSAVLNEGLPNAIIHISPNEEWLAYYELVSNDMCFCGTGEVFIQNLKTNEITELKGRGLVGSQLLFTNHSKVVYSSRDGDKSYLYVSDLSKFE